MTRAIRFGCAAVFLIACLQAPTCPAEPATQLAMQPATQPATKPAAPPAILSLRLNEMPLERRLLPALANELCRQAMLVAGRDELGLRTRDGALGEPLTSEAEAKQFGLAVKPLDVNYAIDATHISVEINSPFETQPARLLPLGTAALVEGDLDLAQLEEQVEPISRKQMVQTLHDLGFTGQRVKWNDARTVPADVWQRMAGMNPVTQFEAVRLLHDLIRTDGESPQRLGALTIAYANLGQLCSLSWNQSPKAFAARSLVYAQRYVAAMEEHGASPDAKAMALWHRAYARAMAGLHAAALADLDRAGKLAPSSAATHSGESNDPAAATGAPVTQPAADVTAPAWVNLISMLCHYDKRGLSEAVAGDPTTRSLAAMFCYLVTEGAATPAVHADTLEWGKAALQVDSENIRIADAMTEVSGVSYQHSLTAAAPEVFSQTLGRTLEQFANLPPSVRDAIARARRGNGDMASRGAIFRECTKPDLSAQDQTEPSWGAFGRMVQEIRFVQTYRRAYFLHYMYSSGGPEYIAEVAPLIADHPYHLMIDTLTTMDPALLHEKLSPIKLGNLSLRARPLWERLQFATVQPDPKEIVRYAFACVDATAWDHERMLRYMPADYKESLVQLARRLQSISPFSPAGRVGLIAYDWNDQGMLNAADWEKEAIESESPGVLAALANQYMALGDTAAGQRCLQEWINCAPDGEAYSRLAQSYRDAGNEEKWVTTLEASLKGEDYGLEHSRTLKIIADHYMHSGRYEKALPYAQQSAASGAGWALATLAECDEALGRWDEAEAVIKDNGDRYGMPLEWLQFCRRTGHGDVKAAQARAGQMVAQMNPRDGREQAVEVASYYLLCTDLDPNAAKLADKTFDEQLKRAPGDVWAGLHLAFLRDAAHDTAGRDDAIKRGMDGADKFRFNRGEARPQLTEFASAICLIWTQSGPELMPATIDGWIDNASTLDKANISFFAGKYFDSIGKPDLAEEYYRRSTVFTHTATNGVLATVILRNRDAAAAAATQPGK